MPLVVDITDEGQVEEAVFAAQSEFGQISGLINNAAKNPAVGPNGIVNRNRLEDFGIETWNADLAVGLGGAFLCSKYFGMVMAAQKNGGVIINISSDLGLISPDQRIYQTKNTPMDQQSVELGPERLLSLRLDPADQQLGPSGNSRARNFSSRGEHSGSEPVARFDNRPALPGKCRVADLEPNP